MIILPIPVVNALNEVLAELCVPVLVVLRDGRHGIVTRDNLRRRDVVIASALWDTFGSVPASLSDALIKAAVESGVAEPVPDPFGGLDDTANEFVHVDDRPRYLCPACQKWSSDISATWTNATPAAPSAGPVWALCPTCLPIPQPKQDRET